LSPLTVIFLSFVQQAHNTCSFSGTKLAHPFYREPNSKPKIRNWKSEENGSIPVSLLPPPPALLDDEDDDDDAG